MISSSSPPQGISWGDEPVTLEIAMRLYASLCANDLVQSLEDDGWEPGELHRRLAVRAVAAAATFADALEALQAQRRERRRRAPS